MRAFFIEFRSRIRLTHAIVVLTGILIAAYGASAIVSLQRSYQQTLSDAVANLDSVSRSAEIGTTRTIFEVDAMLLGIEQMLAVIFPDAALDDARVGAVLRQFNEQNMNIRNIMVLDMSGVQINSGSSTVARRRNVANKPFFTAHVGRGVPTLYVGSPERSRATGEWSIVVSRPLMRGDQMLGVIAADIPTPTFTNFFNSIITSSGMVIGLTLDNGVLVACEPHREEKMGREIVLAQRLLAAVAKKRSGLIETDRSSAFPDRLISYRAVAARPLIVMVARERSAVLHQWYYECGAALLAFLFFAIVAMILTWLVVRALNRHHTASLELQRSEESLKRQSILLQNTLENMGEGLSVFDRHGQLIAWNKRFTELLGLDVHSGADVSVREIVAFEAGLGSLSLASPAGPAGKIQPEVAAFFRNVPTVREWMIPSAQVLQLRRRAMPDGGVVTLYSDVTEIKESEREMANARTQAELANRSKTDFLANMSHELRTPLNAIIGFSEIMSKALLGALQDQRYVSYAKDIHASGLHLLSIINDVLDMSKIESGRLELYEEAVLIRSVVASAVRMIDERARNNRVQIVLDLPDRELLLWADERAMKQILLNVLSNAIKFSNEGGSVTIRGFLDGENRTILEIEDGGIGMSPDEMERSLLPFGQAQAVTTRTYGGTGLGLPITKGLADAHGATLEIESRISEGTIVRLTFPAFRTQPEPMTAARDPIDTTLLRREGQAVPKR